MQWQLADWEGGTAGRRCGSRNGNPGGQDAALGREGLSGAADVCDVTAGSAAGDLSLNY